MSNALDFFLSCLPILLLVVALGFVKLPAHWATPATLLVAAVIAVSYFGMSPLLVGTAALDGAAQGLWPIMLVIVSAIYAYKLALRTGSLDKIKRMLSAVSPDRRVQVLILAWGFGGFLEAVAGYGTAVAIPASILIVLGFEPLFAAVICLIANTVPTAFGAVGIAVTTLAQITGIDTGILSWVIGLQLTPFIILVPLALVAITGVPDARPGAAPGSIRRGFPALKGVTLVALASGAAFALPQLLAARFIGPELPALLGSVCSMLVTVFIAKGRKRTAAAIATATATTAVSTTTPSHAVASGAEPRMGIGEAVMAWLPYILISGLIILTSPLVAPVNHALSKLATTVTIYSGEHAKAQTFKWLVTPGALIMIAAFIYAAISRLKLADVLKLMGQTLLSLRFSFITVISILAMAKIMSYSGMTSAIAVALVGLTGSFYPLVASFVGALGTFVTGSDTSSNILFGKLQVEAATRSGIDPYWLSAANTSGATAGKMISPQSIAVATGATGLSGKEGTILSRTVVFCLAYVALLGVLVLFAAPFADFGG